ncbi:MAG: nitrogen regulation protein NR(II) [Vicinamibacterales bacterium]
MPDASAAGYAFLGLTVIVSLLLAVLAFATLRFAAAAKDSRRRLRDTGMETAVLSAALEEAIGKLKAQERATAARADRSERLSGQIIAGLTSGLLLVERDGTAAIVNPAALRILGLAPAGPTPYRDLLGDVPALAEVIAEGLAGGAPIVRRTVALARPAGPSHLGVTVSPIADADGRLQAVVCLFTDLTGVLALEARLQLKDALARLGELTAGLAHEFRNGLATIHGYGRLIDPAEVPPQYRACVEGIRAETVALGEVVTRFLDFARPDALALTRVDLADIVARAAADVDGGSAVRIGGRFGAVDGDEVLLRQAFSNLLRNAAEACASAGVAPDVRVDGEVDAAAGVLRVRVRDNGPGLADPSDERLFRPFFTTKDNGTGLGLAIVQKVAVGHNGRVSAANHPDGGAEFVVQLPLA